MLLHSLTLLPVNLLHVAFFTLTSVGVLLIWHSKVYRSLAFFFIYQSVLMGLNFLEETQIVALSYLITPVLNLLVGPLIYFFIRSIVHEHALGKRKTLLHLMPMFIAIPFTVFTQTVIALGSLSQVVYLVLSFQLLSRYHKISKSARADAETMALSWMTKALSIFAIIVITDLIRLNLQTNAYLTIHFKMAWYFIDTLVLFCISLFLLYKAISKPKLFTGMVSYEKLMEKTKSDNDFEDIQSAHAIFKSIEKLIVEQQLFKQQRLSVTDVADRSGLTVKDLSWAINLGAGKNFCEYINALRIQYLKETIEAGKQGHSTLLDLAFDSGFGSKSTFNSVFKREVGMTPTQFISELPSD